MHQGSVLSPLLCVVVMDVDPSETRSSIPSELLYADNLVLKEPLVRRVTESYHTLQRTEGECRKVMVGSSDGNIIVNYGNRPWEKSAGKHCYVHSM